MTHKQELGEFASAIYKSKYSWKDEQNNPIEEWEDTARRVAVNVLGALGYEEESSQVKDITRAIAERKFLPGGRYLAQAGRPVHYINNCFLYRCEDSREGWADLLRKSILSLSSGGGVGVVYSDVRASGSYINRTGGMATGPLSPAKMVNEVAREVMAGGSRRSAIWGGLHWNHKDIFEWIKSKDWAPEVKAAKAADYNAPAPLDMTNISVILDDDFFDAYGDESNSMHAWAQDVYWQALSHMLQHGEPGFSIDTGWNRGENLRNPCCEVTSRDDSDVCCLGSLNFARIESIDELNKLIPLATLFLLAGTAYSDVPHEEVKRTREKNRRLGLGFMGVHEWLIQRGYSYEVVPELRNWLKLYEDGSDEAAKFYSNLHKLSTPKAVRSIAPTGTIGIIAETTTGIEPVFVQAYKRKFLQGTTQHYQYVVDPTVARMIDQYGVKPSEIETAFDLAYDVERRIKFQADIQKHVDMAISSTINLPAPVTEPEWIQHYGDIFMKHLPNLRGLTVYPNGARSGQPLEPVPYEEAIGKTGVTFIDDRSEQCVSGVCGV